MADVDSVKLQSEKTKAFRVDSDGVAQLDLKNVRAGEALSYPGTHPARKVSFLGFDFDGRVIRVRQSTVGRCHKRLNEVAAAIARSNEGGMRPRNGSLLCINIIRRLVLGEEGCAPRPAMTLLHFSATETFFLTQREPERRFQMIRLPSMRLRFTVR